MSYMGLFLGKRDFEQFADQPPVVLRNLHSKEQVLKVYGLIPEQDLLTDEEWLTLKNYFLKQAPENPTPQENHVPVTDSLVGFKLHSPKVSESARVNTMVRVDENNSQILLADAGSASLTFFNSDLVEQDILKGFPLIVDYWVDDTAYFFLSIGDLMGSSVNIPRGFLLENKKRANTLEKGNRLMGLLHRPSDFLMEDFNDDGSNEIVICHFGDFVGKVVLYQRVSGQVKEHSIISSRPGAVRVESFDFNKDGLKDLAVLFGHERENITLFLNNGDLTFTEKQVLSMHSAYGHTYFEVQDFNSDGYADFLVANGDSDADPYNTLKYYHGIRIYLNDGNNSFEESFFYPMHGVHFAKAADFDGDGDLDIAANSFFPDFNNPSPEKFTFLENKGDLNFQAFTHPETYNGRWMVMDVGDYDGDNDIDIVLASGYLPIGMVVNHMDEFNEMQETGKSMLVFENLLFE